MSQQMLDAEPGANYVRLGQTLDDKDEGRGYEKEHRQAPDYSSRKGQAPPDDERGHPSDQAELALEEVGKRCEAKGEEQRSERPPLFPRSGHRPPQ